MPYWPVAEILGKAGIPRGPGSYMNLGGYPASQVVPRSNGWMAPGAAPVTAAVGRAMAAATARGGGPAGTRMMAPTAASPHGPITMQVPLAMTPGAAPARRLGAYGGPTGGGRMMMRAGTTRALPAGPGFATYANPTYGLGAIGTGPNDLPGLTASDASWYATANAWATRYDRATAQRLLDQGFVGALTHGKPPQFSEAAAKWGIVKGGGATGTPSPSSSVYAAAKAAGQSLVDKIQNGALDPETPWSAFIPTEPPAPATGAPASDVSAFNDYVHLRDVSYPLAKQTGRILWASSHYQAPASSAVTPTPASSTMAVGTQQTGADGSVYSWTGTGWQLVSTPIPASSTPGTSYYQQPAPVTTYAGGDPYSASAPEVTGTYTQTAPMALPTTLPDGSGGISTGGAADATVAATGAPKLTGKAGIGIAVVAAAGIGLWLWSRRKKKAA